MRFGLRAKSVEKVEEVKAGLITSRRIIFTPDTELKDELAKTAVQITCYDRDGKEVKRVTSTSGEVEDDTSPQPSPNGEGASQTEGGDSGNQGSGENGGGSGNTDNSGGNMD
jgi:Tol biopolymer transport system component